MTTERIDVLAVLRQMQVNSGHYRYALPVLADHHEGEHERELAAIAAVAELTEKAAAALSALEEEHPGDGDLPPGVIAPVGCHQCRAADDLRAAIARMEPQS